MNLQAGNVAIALARGRKKHQIACALLIARAVFGGRAQTSIVSFFLEL